MTGSWRNTLSFLSMTATKNTIVTVLTKISSQAGQRSFHQNMTNVRATVTII